MSSSSTQSSLNFYDYKYELNGKIYSFSISAPDVINSFLAAESAAIITYFPELLATGEGIPVATALLVMGVAAGTLLDVLTGINAPNATPSNVVGATVLDGILTAAETALQTTGEYSLTYDIGGVGVPINIYSNGSISVPSQGVTFQSNGQIVVPGGTLSPAAGGNSANGFDYQFTPSSGGATTSFRRYFRSTRQRQHHAGHPVQLERRHERQPDDPRHPVAADIELRQPGNHPDIRRLDQPVDPLEQRQPRGGHNTIRRRIDQQNPRHDGYRQHPVPLRFGIDPKCSRHRARRSDDGGIHGFFTDDNARSSGARREHASLTPASSSAGHPSGDRGKRLRSQLFAGSAAAGPLTASGPSL